MGDDRGFRGYRPDDYAGRGNDMGSRRDYGTGRDDPYAGSRGYGDAGMGDRGDRDSERADRNYYGGRQPGRQRDGGSGADRDDRGGYAVDGYRFGNGDRFGQDARDERGDRGSRGNAGGGRGYGRQPEGYDYQDRGFIARAGDEVRSWFGDDDAERRREFDARYDERAGNHRDADYHSWRTGQIAALDRDYDEYRRENQDRFHNEFSSWRSTRQGQRDALSKVQEHAEVVGADGEHVGTVDKVRGDRILLTKTDVDAGGKHHSIPSNWITGVDGNKVTLAKTAADAKQAWQDEERSQAMSGWGDNATDRGGDDITRGRTLNRSFSGTY